MQTNVLLLLQLLYRFKRFEHTTREPVVVVVVVVVIVAFVGAFVVVISFVFVVLRRSLFLAIVCFLCSSADFQTRIHTNIFKIYICIYDKHIIIFVSHHHHHRRSCLRCVEYIQD